MVKIEPTNGHNIHAVAIYRDTEIVGHVPYNLAPRMSAFLIRNNKAFAEITGAKVKRGAGYGLEVPCVYHQYGPYVYVDKMKELVASLLADGHYNLCSSNFAQCRHFLNYWVQSMVVLGGEFILLLFIAVMAAGCWSELRGGCFWEVYKINWIMIFIQHNCFSVFGRKQKIMYSM